ncbi:MAG: glycosyltransferase [Cyanobacteriota bacterium]|nr:glycosyltransferase [Cyanobacteriota bacterium]
MGLRISLYSHDAQGLGHARRNLNLARSLIRSNPDSDILLICGTPHVAGLDIPGNIDTLILPQIRKNINGDYRSKARARSLKETILLRRDIITTTLDRYQPDVLIVDKHPFGLKGELKPAMDTLRQRKTLMVLGIRDILDDPQVARNEWEKAEGPLALQDYYTSAWIYGDQNVSDPMAAFALSEQDSTKRVFTGYLNPLDLERTTSDLLCLPPGLEAMGSYCLCKLGGGQDGFGLAKLFMEADYGTDRSGVIILGPFMDESSRGFLKTKAKNRSDLYVLDFASPMLPIIARADCVVSLGGYNSVCEIISLGKRALIIPRTTPRTEQLIRARKMHAYGLVDYIKPETLTTSMLSEWISASSPGGHQALNNLDFGGFSRIPELVRSMIEKKHQEALIHQ